MNTILLASSAISNGVSIFKPLYWLFGICMNFLLDVLGNQYFLAIIILYVDKSIYYISDIKGSDDP